MDTAGKDTTRFQHIGEHQREAMLLNFAEPLQFLHNLDLAHVFEHYYRWVNVWLVLSPDHYLVPAKQSSPRFTYHTVPNVCSLVVIIKVPYCLLFPLIYPLGVTFRHGYFEAGLSLSPWRKD